MGAPRFHFVEHAYYSGAERTEDGIARAKVYYRIRERVRRQMARGYADERDDIMAALKEQDPTLTYMQLYQRAAREITRRHNAQYRRLLDSQIRAELESATGAVEEIAA